MTAAVPSITRVNKAGDVLRSVLFNTTSPTALADVDLDAFNAAFDLLVAWRTAHATPLRKATMGLRSCVATARCAQIEVSQRLKRTPTIIDKLRREPRMELGRMADIGGCRAVLQDQGLYRGAEAGRLPGGPHLRQVRLAPRQGSTEDA